MKDSDIVEVGDLILDNDEKGKIGYIMLVIGVDDLKNKTFHCRWLYCSNNPGVVGVTTHGWDFWRSIANCQSEKLIKANQG